MDIMDAATHSEQPNPLVASSGEAGGAVGRLGAAGFSDEQAAALHAEIGKSVRAELDKQAEQLASSPTNWHQATVWACASSEPRAIAARGWLFAGSCTLIGLQLVASIGALRNTHATACSKNDQCPREGMFCEVFVESEDSSKSANGFWQWTSSLVRPKRCNYCGSATPVPVQLNELTGEVFNRPAETRGWPTGPDELALPRRFFRSGMFAEQGTFWRQDWPADGGPVGLSDAAAADPSIGIGTIEAGWNWTTIEWVCKNPGLGHTVSAWSREMENSRNPVPAEFVVNWCEKCVFALERRLDELTFKEMIMGNCSAMGAFDILTLCLAAWFLSLASWAEQRDCRLCDIAIAQASKSLSPGWVRALQLLGGIRLWVFLPSLMNAVTCLVVVNGGDALSICLNTIAVLFLYDVDNMAFAHLLSDELRCSVIRGGRVLLSAQEAHEMQIVRRTSTPAVVAGLLMAVLAAATVGNAFVPLPVNFLAVLVAAIAVETQIPARSARQRVMAMATATGKMVLGCAAFMTLLGLANLV